jgi:hypothetical protein
MGVVGVVLERGGSVSGDACRSASAVSARSSGSKSTSAASSSACTAARVCHETICGPSVSARITVIRDVDQTCRIGALSVHPKARAIYWTST